MPETGKTSTANALPPHPDSQEAAVYQRFNSYPWSLDRPFLQGLASMLGPMTDSFDKQKSLGISLQARMWWYQTRQNVTIERADYEAWVATNPGVFRPDPELLIKIEQIKRQAAAQPAVPVPSWQTNTPKADLGRKADDARGEHRNGGDAPYPQSFQAIVEAVTLGKPVPGAREIPNTVARQPGVTPVGKMRAPRKPWQKQAGDTETGQTVSSSFLDQQFPPVSDDQDETDTGEQQQNAAVKNS